MNQKFEPVLGEPVASAQALTQLPEIEKPEDADNIINILRKQTALNAEIISVLSTKELSKEEQRNMVQMLSDGHKKSLTFTKILQENSDNINIDINEAIPAKSNIKDKFNKFKNMIISAKANVDPTIVFRNPKKPDWYEVGYGIAVKYNVISSKTKSVQKTLNSFLTQAGANLNVAVQKAKNANEFFQSQFNLIGEKKHVKVLEKKFTKVFELLGLEAKEVLHSSKIKENLSDENLMNNILSKLDKDLSAKKDASTNKFSFSLLNGLSPELQFDMAQSLLWPKLNSSIKECMDINQSLKESKDDNRYLKLVTEFANNNKFNPDLVIHSLKNNPELLAGYAKINVLIDNKDKIIENADKYGKFIINNFKYLETLVKVADDLTKMINSININPELKSTFTKNLDDTVIFADESNKITFGQLKANVVSVHAEEKEYSPKLSKNS